MLGTCRQYIRDLHEAEDVMLHAFMKVFQNIGQFKNEGSLEGWIRRIMIRECISFLRQKKEYMFVDDVGQNHLRMLTTEDRKSTRLNSSHVRISYAVFCLKKKKNKQ